MPLKAIHEKVDEIPEAFRPLYTERDGKFELTGIEGTKTQADIDRIQEGLRKEKNDHKETKTRLSAWGELKYDEVLAKLDRYPELEALAAKGGVDEKKIDELVETRIRSKLAPVERERDKYKTDLLGATQIVEQMTLKERTRSVHDAVRKAGTAAKIVDTALEDVLMLSERIFEINEKGDVVTKDGVGVTPGIGADVWLTEMQAKRPHWWGPSVGGGAGGGGGSGGGGMANNPWSKDAWSLTEQGNVFRSQGAAKAEQLAKLAGSHIGATHPTK